MKESHINFFNARANGWDIKCQHDDGKIRKIVSLLKIQGHERILDVGTGTGVLIPFYEEYVSSGSVVAIDCSDRMIDVARTKFPEQEHPQVEFKAQDIYDSIYEDEFDIVVCYSCFPHLQDRRGAVSIIQRALKPGGTFVVAHSDSRGRINHIHTGAEEVSTMLPAVAELASLVKNMGLEPVYQQDDDDCYIMVARK